MWWKVLIAVLCGALVISPVDFSLAHLGIDDFVGMAGMIGSIIAMVADQQKKLKAKMQTDADEDPTIQDVEDN